MRDEREENRALPDAARENRALPDAAQDRAVTEEAQDRAENGTALDGGNRALPDAAQDGDVTEEAEGFSEKERAVNRPGEAGAETRQPKTDWVDEAYRCFIKDAGDIDPTDPVKAVEAYFNKNATDELKARCKAEGKDAKGCWRFIKEVARKALHGSSGHIDPGVVYAIAMHWFEDVPVNWDKKDEPKKAAAPKKTASVQQQAAKPKTKPKKPAETPSEIRKEKERMAKVKAKADKAKKPKQQQGFFFEMLEMQPDEQKPCGSSSPQASAGASGEENAMEPSSLPASTSSTESEVQG